MLRKFIITMPMKRQLKRLGENYNLLNFEKCNIKQCQIVSYDEDDFKTDKNYDYNIEYERGMCFSSLGFLYSLLGINKYNPYRTRNLLREIKSNDKDGYCSCNICHIENETEKAYKIKDIAGLHLLPKSQCIVEGDTLHIKRWLLYK